MRIEAFDPVGDLTGFFGMQALGCHHDIRHAFVGQRERPAGLLRLTRDCVQERAASIRDLDLVACICGIPHRKHTGRRTAIAHQVADNLIKQRRVAIRRWNGIACRGLKLVDHEGLECRGRNFTVGSGSGEFKREDCNVSLLDAVTEYFSAGHQLVLNFYDHNLQAEVPMIKYIGSKRALLNHIVGTISHQLPNGGQVADLFSGTARVGHALKREGFQVWSNDHNAYAHALAVAYVQSDRETWDGKAARLIDELSRVKPEAGWFTEKFCKEARYFHPSNGARIDAIRERIEDLSLDPELKAIALVSLMEAADRVDSTAGIQMAYMKSWAARAHNVLEMRLPDLTNQVGEKCVATCRDAVSLASEIEADLVYLDPPYNQHSYLGNYHIWESLVLWDKPETYGIANKRIDVQERKSPFNSKVRIGEAVSGLLKGLSVKNIVLSFNDEGYLSKRELSEMLGEKGRVQVIEIEHQRYVGAKIGIHNLRGEKVGKVGRLRNVEYLFVVSDKKLALAA